MVEINFNHRKPTDVIALRRVDELRSFQINADKTQITIGAGLPYQTMEHGAIAELVPALAQAARTVGSPQIRSAGSIGGNLGTCSPAGDALPVLSALDATVNLQTANTSRSVSIHDFMVGVKRNSRQPGEIIVSTTLPIVSGWQGYAKVGVRNAMVISIASCCLVVDRLNGKIAIALGAVGHRFAVLARLAAISAHAHRPVMRCQCLARSTQLSICKLPILHGLSQFTISWSE